MICAVVNLDRERAVKIAKGDRIAQLVIVAIPEVKPTWVERAAAVAAAATGGFGSTGHRMIQGFGTRLKGSADPRLDWMLHADVAQLVEHHLAKVGVAGSNPVVRSRNDLRKR